MCSQHPWFVADDGVSKPRWSGGVYRRRHTLSDHIKYDRHTQRKVSDTGYCLLWFKVIDDNTPLYNNTND